jgi:hypothetical protein
MNYHLFSSEKATKTTIPNVMRAATGNAQRTAHPKKNDVTIVKRKNTDRATAISDIILLS